MESNVPSAGSVITAAVAGNERTRRLRACIAQATCPNLDNRFAIAGAEGPGVPPPLEMTGAKAAAVINVVGNELPDNIKPFKINATSTDTVLIIGQVCFKYFNNECEPLLSGINGSDVYVMGGTEAEDFNISEKGIAMLERKGCTIDRTASKLCPKYEYVEWAPLISKYDTVARDVHNIAVAAFLTSRTATMDGAFYRQFGLAAMARVAEGKGGAIINFESTLAKKVQKTKAGQFPQEIKDKMQAIIDYCVNHENPDYGEGKAGGREQVYTTLYSMWEEALNADSHPKLMATLSVLILESLQQVRSPGANEYDGYTTAKMLYKLAGVEQLTKEQHYKDLMSLFNTRLCAPAWVTGLSKILRKGNLYVYHDAGLDPYVDDYIALKILNAAHGELGMYRALDNPTRRERNARRGGGRRRKRRKKTKKKKKRKSKKGARKKKRKTKKNRRKTKKRRRR